MRESSLGKEGADWKNGTLGKVKIRFAERNDFGVLDHDVRLESGVTIHNPMRVLPNGAGSEVIFSLFHLPDASDPKFIEDAKWVAGDLRALKGVLER
jgi:hypothetical protein